jgi:hypothetical protein
MRPGKSSGSYDEYLLCCCARPSRRTGKPMSAEATMFCTLKVGERDLEAELLDDARVLARGELRVVLGLGASADHFAAGKNERRRLGLANAHDHGGEALRIVLGVARVQRNRLEVERDAEIDSRHNVLQRGLDATGVLGAVERLGGRGVAAQRAGDGVAHNRVGGEILVATGTTAVGNGSGQLERAQIGTIRRHRRGVVELNILDRIIIICCFASSGRRSRCYIAGRC